MSVIRVLLQGKGLMMGHACMGRGGTIDIEMFPIFTALNAKDWVPKSVSQEKIRLTQGLLFRVSLSSHEIVLCQSGEIRINPRPTRQWEVNRFMFQEREVDSDNWPVIPQGAVVIRKTVDFQHWTLGKTIHMTSPLIADTPSGIPVRTLETGEDLVTYLHRFPMLIKIPCHDWPMDIQI